MRETPEQLREIERLWKLGLKRQEIAERTGIKARRIDLLRDNGRLNLENRRGLNGGISSERPPSPLEVRARSAAIRATWSEQDFADRTVGARVLSDTRLQHEGQGLGRTIKPTRPHPLRGRLT